jgi:CRP-like cAMP-binding protein
MKPITKTYKPGSYLFRENDRSRELFIIQSGTVKIYKKSGVHDIELAELSKGAVLGEMALIDGKPRSASAKVIDECTTIVIDSDTFFNNISEVPTWFMPIIKMACQKIRQANLQLKSDPIEYAQEGSLIIAFFYIFNKYKTNGQIEVGTSKQYLVQLLGTTDQKTTAALNFLKANNFITISEDKISIENMGRYTEYCDYLRFLIRKNYIKSISFTPEVYKLIIEATIKYPEILKSNEPVSTINGNAFRSIVESCGLSASYDIVLVVLKENNLLSCVKSGTKDEQSQNPLTPFLFKINNNNWKKICLYTKYHQYTPGL